MLLSGIAGFQIGLALPVNIRIANGVELVDELAPLETIPAALPSCPGP